MFQEIKLIGSYLLPNFLSEHLKEHCIHQNRFVDTHCIALKHYHTQQLFTLLCFLFVDLDLFKLNLFKSL